YSRDVTEVEIRRQYRGSNGLLGRCGCGSEQQIHEGRGIQTGLLHCGHAGKVRHELVAPGTNAKSRCARVYFQYAVTKVLTAWVPCPDEGARTETGRRACASPPRSGTAISKRRLPSVGPRFVPRLPGQHRLVALATPMSQSRQNVPGY